MSQPGVAEVTGSEERPFFFRLCRANFFTKYHCFVHVSRRPIDGIVAVRDKGRHVPVAKSSKVALAAVVANAKYELIPLKNVRDQAAAVPPKSQVTVTASPQHTLETTLEISEFVVGLGHDVTPHFSARMTRTGAPGGSAGARQAIGLKKVFVVGGDAKEPGEYTDGLSLLRAMSELGHPFEHVGVPAYPEGHARISGRRADAALKDKQQYADSMTTQMCFNPGRVATWIGQIRAGCHAADRPRRPGRARVDETDDHRRPDRRGQSAKFLSKNIGPARRAGEPRLLRRRRVLEGAGRQIADPTAKIVGPSHLHHESGVPAPPHGTRNYLRIFAANPADALYSEGLARRVMSGLESLHCVAPRTGHARDNGCGFRASRPTLPRRVMSARGGPRFRLIKK